MFREKIIDNSNFCLIASWCCIFHEQLCFVERRFKSESEQIENICKIKIVCYEALKWYDMWKYSNELGNVKSKPPDETIIRYCKFYPAVRRALLIALTLTSTTFTVERSFRTLRRVKTWLLKTFGKFALVPLLNYV